jgi:hypothetical protein
MRRGFETIMFERVFGCLIGSFGVWIALLLLTSNAAGGISEFLFYADALISAAVFAALLLFFVAPVVYLRILPPNCEAISMSLVKFTSDTWQPTTITHLENLKNELRAIEERAAQLRTCELQIQTLYQEPAPHMEIWLAERGLSIFRHQCRHDLARAAALREAICRIYQGDVDHELLDYQESIAELQRQKISDDPDSLVSQWINDRIDRKIRACQRAITELERWRSKITAATTSPYEAAWTSFIDLATRNAAAPLVEAVTRLEADRTAIDIKRHYEYLVEREWRHGRLSQEEADFIRQRVREEFLKGEQHSV